MGIFDKRVAFKPFEYPEVCEYRDAINHSYWLVSEWNFTSDIQDFHVNLDDKQRSAIKNALLAISQIEISVKRFWTKLGERFPKAEIEQVGVTFGESEVRHASAYSHLLEVLGFNDEFEQLLQVPVIQNRVDYLTKYLRGAADDSHQNYTLALTLFSIFIENVSLFGQFAIIKAFNKHHNLLKDVDNVVQATLKEECYVEGTEVLTPGGWVDFRDINIGDDVVQYNHGTLEFVKVLHKTCKRYEGDVYHFQTDATGCMVTPGHEMIYYNPAGELKMKQAKDFRPHSKTRVPRGGRLNNEGIDEITWDDRLRIAIQADGTTRYWVNTAGETLLRGKCGGYTHAFGLTKQRKKDRLEWILKNGGWDYKTEIDGRETRYEIRYNQDHDYKEFDWVHLKNKSQTWCSNFIEECVQWDGYQTEVEHTQGYCSTNKRAIDKIQTIAIFAGYLTTIQRRIDTRKESYKDTYKLSLMLKNPLPTSHALKKSQVNYSGNVYCVTVPSSAIVTRYNNSVMFAGNCVHALFGAHLIDIIKRENPEWFDEEFYEKLYRASKKAYEAESAIVDWIYENGELDCLPANTLKEFLKSRFNDSLQMIGGEPVFEVDEKSIADMEWFNVEIYAQVDTDFFHKRPVSYSKKVQAFTAEDLF